MELAGHQINLVEGSYDNIKVTTPEDWALAELILKRRGMHL
jgi:2-C-methyl-D-erythritol 4-phosphate cytidylyltransferase